MALHEGAQVWVYEVTSGRAPATIDFWQLGVCPDITQADILEATEDFDLKPLPIDPNYHTIKFPLEYEPNEDRTVAFALADRWPIVRQPALMKARAWVRRTIRNLESPGCPGVHSADDPTRRRRPPGRARRPSPRRRPPGGRAPLRA